MIRGALQWRLPFVVALAVVLAAAAGSGRAGTSRGTATLSATAIAAGLAQSCVVTSSGGVKCWGSNGHDELGDGTTRDSLTPVDASGLSSGVKAVAAGVRHTCALTSAGGVKCWGNSSFGSLGDGTNVRRFTPVDVSGLSSGVEAIAAGLDHTCALTNAGGVKCWGYNRFGSLGDGTTTDRWTPVDVSGLGSGVTAISAGFGHSCALTSAGGVKCWGSVAGDRLTPVDVPGLSGGVRAIATSGSHSCALTTAGGIKCWGSNANGQLGDGTLNSSSTPVNVVGLSGGVRAIATGTGGSCALSATGGVKCWGLNDHGQLGDGTTVNRSTPVGVSGLSRGVTAIAAGSFHRCALTTSRRVKCWGLNGSGQLGDRTIVDRRTPVSVRGFWPQATLAIVSRAVAVTPARVALVRVRCGSQARCPGTIGLTAGVTKLGSRAFSIAAGRAQSIAVRLTARGFKLLVRAKRLAARVRISFRQPAGGATTVTRTITLTAP
jgi:alpha-tubulin suppressor-like RCC1 family protein